MIPVILAGGSGSRLWPLSRSSHPKQFLKLTGDTTMLQKTLLRLKGIEGIQSPEVICNDDHRFLVAEQLRELGSGGRIILEPFGRNTAPAIAVAALVAVERDPDSLIMVLPADHLIPDTPSFHQSVQTARAAAMDGYLVTFGVTPTRPETGYGYIRAEGKGEGAKPVKEFVEKPDQETADQYLASGEYFWNSGMFLFRASRMLEEMERFAPEVLKACRDALTEGARDLDFARLDPDAFATCPDISIDYAVMEKTDSAMVVPLDADWSDVGCWASLHELERGEGDGNVLLGDVLAEDTTNSYVRSESRLVAAVGMDGCIIVETSDAVLVADKSRAQDVKKIVERLKQADREEHEFHRRVHRPWGFYEGVTKADRFQVKHIIVNPGAALSVQMHHHRAEHWVVVRGTARVTCGDKNRLVSEDQSTYIPLGTVHRLENPGVIPLELIEVQTGSYLGEDDILRFEDKYQRTK